MDKTPIREWYETRTGLIAFLTQLGEYKDPSRAHNVLDYHHERIPHPFKSWLARDIGDLLEEVDITDRHKAAVVNWCYLQEDKLVQEAEKRARPEFSDNLNEQDLPLLKSHLKFYKRQLRKYSDDDYLRAYYEESIKRAKERIHEIESSIEEERLDQTDQEDKNRDKPTNKQKLLLIHYLQKNGLFPQFDPNKLDKRPMAEFIVFLTSGDLHNTRHSLGALEKLKTRDNLLAVKAIAARIGLSQIIAMVEEDLKDHEK